MSNNTGRRTGTLGSGAARVAADRAKHVLSVLFATFAAIALIAGVAVSGFSTPKAEAQVCRITNPKTFTGAVTAASPTGTNPQHQIDLVFPQAAYVNSVTINSRVKLGNENFGKWRITLGGKTLTSGDGVRVSYTSGKPGSVVFDFDTPIQVGANSQGNANITLFAQSGAATNYSMTYTGSVTDPCPPPSPTTSQQPSPATTEPSPATTEPTAGTSQPEPTSAEPTPDTSVPSTSAQPEPTPTSQPRPTSTTPVPTTSNPGATSGAPTNEPTPTAPTTSVDPKAGTGEAPSTDRGLRSGEIGVRVRAAAFRTESSQYSKGIKFRVWTAQDFYESDGTTYDYRKTQDVGPVAPINESWATCTTNANGECTIYFPANRRRATYFIVQENEYPGTFHIGKYNWGEYGNFDKRTNASVPGWVNIRNNDSTFETVDITDGRLTTNAYWRPLWSSAQSLNNPPMEKVRKCQASGGPKIALVLDRTLSIKAADGETDYQNAVYGANGFLDSLVGTGASVAFFPFADHSLASGTMTTPVSVDTNLAQAKANATAALKTGGALTNWESGFEAVRDSGQIFDEVILVTDGDANKWFAGGREQSVNIDGSVPGIEAGIYAANELKAKGMRVVSIGVASAKNYQYWNGSGQMKSVSGPQYGVDYFGTDWSRLAGTLRAAGSEVTCQIEFEVNKQVVSFDGTPLADQSAAEGWNMSLNVSGIPDPQADIMTGTEVPPFGYLSGDANQVINSSTASASNATHGTPASVHWNLTQYADPNKSNTTAVIGEDVNSKSGYEFVPGKSTYEVQDARTGERRSGGPLQSASQTINGLKPGDRVVVKMVNRVVPQIALQKDLPNGRKKDGDQFELSISKVTGYQGSAYVDSALGSAALTQGSGNDLQKTIDGKTLQAGPFKLEANTKYLLRENAANGANLGDYDTTLKCDGAKASSVPDARRGGSGRVWEVSTGAAVNDNITCTFTNTPVLRTSISWKKIDNENKPLACSQWQVTRMKDEKGSDIANTAGQQWVINDNAAGANCEFQNSALQGKEDEDSSPGSFKVSDLPLGTYKVEEVRAPNGYGLNPKRSSETVELTAANASTGLTITNPFVNYPDTKTPGTLPRTGGVGVGTTAGIAGVIVALGCVMLRRRSV